MEYVNLFGHHENGLSLKLWIGRKEAELTYIVDAVEKTSSMAPSVKPVGPSAANISTCENYKHFIG